MRPKLRSPGMFVEDRHQPLADCSWPKPEEKPDCNNCPVICIDRKGIKASDNSRDDFYHNFLSGTRLRDLAVSHPCNHPQIPLFIPTRTQELYDGETVSLSWAAIDAKLLFSKHKNIPVITRSHIISEYNMRSFYKVTPTTNMIAVLNGRDEILEGFWGANRPAIYSNFEKIGFYAVTGPTFSVTDESEGRLASHNICMMLRHNRVIKELQKTKLIAIPNIYWRNEQDLREWSDWISEQDKLRYISRDFSRTKQNKTFRPQFEGLLKILKLAGKSVHVLLVGVGVRKAEYVMRMLNEINCTCSFVMGYPIMIAILGGCRIKIKKRRASKSI